MRATTTNYSVMDECPPEGCSVMDDVLYHMNRFHYDLGVEHSETRYCIVRINTGDYPRCFGYTSASVESYLDPDPTDIRLFMVEGRWCPLQEGPLGFGYETQQKALEEIEEHYDQPEKPTEFIVPMTVDALQEMY